jgi:cellulose synthase/poly-beta-1,6-N-acetylglucosamine synthase-like glycosyltransferase
MYEYLHYGRASDVHSVWGRRFYRFLEMIPGLLTWLTLILIVVLSFILPIWMSIFIIIFDVYWFIKSIYLSLHLRVAYNQMKENMKVNWLDKLQVLSPEHYRMSAKSWQDLYHIIFLPVYKEDFSIVSSAIESILRSNYPKSKMMVVLCYEERGGEATAQTIKQAEEQYKSSFFQFMSVMHPQGIKGEMPGKGSNAAYAARAVKEQIIDKLQINYDHVLVSNFDVDTVVYPEYFAVLTYKFLTTENPLRASYQPIPFYVNNIWEAPSFARVVAFSATFWFTIKQERWETATTFSSHSLPFRALVDVGFWQRNMVSEDSRIFWQAFLRYDGDYRLVPLFYPVSMDANVASTSMETFKNVYKQQRRWAYGAENIPYFLFGFWKNKMIPLRKKLYYGFMGVEGNHSWATNALLIFVLGWLPTVVGGAEFNNTVLSFNLPFLTRSIMTFAMVGLVTSVVLSIAILPPRPPRFGKFKYLWMILQWLLFPITTIGLGTLPAIDAQTRLMLGKYMGFWVTPKKRG